MCSDGDIEIKCITKTAPLNHSQHVDFQFKEGATGWSSAVLGLESDPLLAQLCVLILQNKVYYYT